MRNILLFLGICMIGSQSIAQESIPIEVQSALYDFHPTAEDVFWEHREGAIVANFFTSGDLTKVYFDEKGNWLETRARTSIHEMPEAVTAFIDQHYQNAEISYTGVVQWPDGRKAYRVESELPSEIVVKIISESGELLEEKRIAFQPIETGSVIQTLPIKGETPSSSEEL